MRYYRLKASDAGVLEGRHRWQLPNRIGCPSCGVYGAIGASHPTIDLSGYVDAKSLSRSQGVSWSHFQVIVSALRSYLTADPGLGPGDTFGPFTGRLDGPPADFMFGAGALLFATDKTVQALDHSGVRLPATAPAEVRRSSDAALLELDFPRGGTLADESYKFLAHRCSVCGRIDGPLERCLLVEGSVPPDLDLFRPANHATVLLASHRFREAVETRQLTGLAFEPIEIS